jgi:hypothetical protein
LIRSSTLEPPLKDGAWFTSTRYALQYSSSIKPASC